MPFLRDAALATDTAGTWDVLRAVVQQYAAIGQQFDTITLLQPTSRFAMRQISKWHLRFLKRKRTVGGQCL